MWPLSGRWRLSGNDQQGLAAPIWKYRSGIGDHRFTFFIDLLPNYTFCTNLTNIVHWVVAYRDVTQPDNVKFRKSWEKYAKAFDAGLRYLSLMWVKKFTNYFLITCQLNSIQGGPVGKYDSIHLCRWERRTGVFLTMANMQQNLDGLGDDKR